MHKNHEKGFAALFVAFLVLFAMLAAAVSITVLTVGEQRVSGTIVHSAQAYYAAEAGVEDALLRLQKRLNWSSPYTLQVGRSRADILITDSFGLSKTITSSGSQENRFRKIETVYEVSSGEISFRYAAQIGEGGIELGQNSSIVGNVYSNGSIDGDNGAQVTGDAMVAGDAASGNYIEDISIGGNAWAPSFEDCSVDGNIVFVTGGEVEDCTAGGTIQERPDPIATSSLPVIQDTIDLWKQEAQEGGVISTGDYEPTKHSTVTIGPGVIQGDMILTNNQTVILEGTIYVQGNIDIDNGTSIRLSSSYGSASGILLTDGWVHTKNNGELKGSGHESSYLVILSTSSCKGNGGSNCTHHGAAIDIHNNAEGAIFYAGDGMINMHNNVELSQATAWKLVLDNNTTLIYSVGMTSTLFSSGPGGSWEVTRWRETE